MDSEQAPKTCKRQAGEREGIKPTARKRSARNRVNSRGKEKNHYDERERLNESSTKKRIRPDF